MRCRHYMRRSDCSLTSATWGARCGKSARRVLRGGTGTSDLVARSVPTHHRVNHDVLLARVARKVKDERVLKLIRRYLEAGLMEGGITSLRTEGTPQGGPLSPLLSNILLDDLDRELERRGLGDRSGTPLHHDQSSRKIGQPGGLKEARSGGQRQRKRGNDRITGAGDI